VPGSTREWKELLSWAQRRQQRQKALPWVPLNRFLFISACRMADKKNAAKQLPPGTKSSGKKGGTWDSLDLLPSVTNVIKNVLNFTSMTPVQSATIPNFLEHKDVAVEVCHRLNITLLFKSLLQLFMSRSHHSDPS
jgi:hypothetical protein